MHLSPNLNKKATLTFITHKSKYYTKKFRNIYSKFYNFKKVTQDKKNKFLVYY